MIRLTPLLLALALSGAATTSFAQTTMEPTSSTERSAHPTLQLEASASRQVPEDTAWALFAVEREAKDQATAQQQAQAALAEVVALARKAGQLDVRTEGMYTSPIYAPKGDKVTGWRSHLELRIESTQTGQVAQTASALMDKARLQGAGFFLSTAKRQEAERELIGAAVQEFQLKAQTTAKALGFASTSYKNVALQQPQMAQPMSTRMFKGARAEADGAPAEPLTLEPGKTEVSVSVSGTVNLLR
ncbi:SIMPL domain-containing protein [Comamonas serinivorans]|nr:SIMPL domain-containing protein [Comamonas serinivorans]